MDRQVKNPPAMQEMGVQSLGQEDPLEKEMATHSSILTGKIPWSEEPGRLWFMVLQRVEHNWSDWTCMHSIIIKEYPKEFPGGLVIRI